MHNGHQVLHGHVWLRSDGFRYEWGSQTRPGVFGIGQGKRKRRAHSKKGGAGGKGRAQACLSHNGCSISMCGYGAMGSGTRRAARIRPGVFRIGQGGKTHWARAKKEGGRGRGARRRR